MIPLPAPDVLARVHDLRTVDLDELNATAELQTRVDRKYILAAEALPRLLADLPGGTAVLQVEGERALQYESRYFDTPWHDSYLGAARGRRRRFKVRARTYVDSGDSFLEVKTRGGRSATVKDRVPVRHDELDAEGVAYATELLTDAGIPRAPWLAEHLDAALVTRYRRLTLLLPAGTTADASRATIDTGLEWLAVDGRVLALPASVIVETKSGQRAGAFDRALWRQGHRPATLSKYGTGLAALHPDLPSNKWRRVLGTHFAAATIGSAPTPTRTAA